VEGEKEKKSLGEVWREVICRGFKEGVLGVEGMVVTKGGGRKRKEDSRGEGE